MRDILVVGDSMLDRYWEGVVERISPEAPVPVLRVTREFCRPGGAANVAANIRALGSQVSLLTVMGEDAPGRELREHLAGVKVFPVGRRTTQKIRSVARHQQLLRTDFDEETLLPDASQLHQRFMEMVPAADVVVFSDYGKGALRFVDLMLGEALALTLVDPKGSDFTKYRNAFLMKPNEAEVSAVIGGYSEEGCESLRKSLNVSHLLVTRGELGMVLFNDAGIHNIETEVVDVYDVSGAGDTVIATIAHCLANGESVLSAVRKANRAAGIVVGKFGTSTVTVEELRAA